MKQQQSLFTLCLLIFLLNFTKILAQSPAAAPAQSPAVSPPQPPAASPPQPPAASPPQPPAASPTQVPTKPGPTNVIKILQKAGHFTVFIRLLQSTQEDNHLLTVLNNTNNGLTIFAPTDNAFSSLKSGTLNSLTDEAKSELVKFHVIPTLLSTSQFQTVTNPLATEAGSGGRVALNVTTYPSSVNITTGLTNTSLTGTVYTDNQLAIYKVEKVLLPLDIFTPKPRAPAPAPAEEKPKKKRTSPVEESPPVDDVPAVASGASCFLQSNNNLVVFGLATLAAGFLAYLAD